MMSKTTLLHRSAVIYEGPVVSLIHQLKYGADFKTLSLFAAWIMKNKGDMILEADVMIPVPLSRKKLSQRGFNQSLELAKMLAHPFKKKVLHQGLKKIRETKAQTQLSQKERQENLRGAFEWVGTYDIRDKNILLIDDVHSTGSTLEACSQAIEKGKPGQIKALTIAYNTGESLPN